MHVRIQLFAAAKEIAGTDALFIELPPEATIGDLQKEVLKHTPGLERIVNHSLWAIGTQYVDRNTRISENSDLALIPPVSGG